MTKSKVQFWTIQLVLIALFIYLCTKISFVFEPIVIFFTTLFFPILVSGFLYFLFSPIVFFLERKRVPKTLAILILYAIFVGIITTSVVTLGPALSKETNEFIDKMPTYAEESREVLDNVSDTKGFRWIVEQEYVSLDKIEESFLNFSTNFTQRLTNSVTTIFSVLTNITLTVVTVPFILFYMLKDGHRLPELVVKVVPAAYREEGLRIIDETTETLATYIQGQMLVALFVGVCASIGYLIIGLPFALALGLIGAVTNIIPYLGPFFGAAPAVVIGLLDSPTKAMLVIVVMLAVQQLEGNVISPLIMGRKLNIHPLTIILLLLVAGNLAGILGMILAIPVYAMTKTIVLNIVRLVKLRARHKYDPAQ
ncbi:AI-2E family transporter [Metabacillus iocasae]|uniref:PurR-regulated permease PerM n=1 Tax=Priestia iocasae TaxID=2291674 RepID=A0ABS2QUB4_9BACI|nr:AI-2E family transporter [Metabacillus iocasae]MBM7703061.1 putative PurR-regulated permease PerM [Metabacillus iocasae]